MTSKLPRLWIAALILAVPAFASAQTSFGECLARLQRLAVEDGVPPETVHGALASVSEAAHVIQADRRQPEFVETFASYLSRTVTADRVARGRERLRRHESLLAELTARYGVPPQYLIAFWGLETNYGGYLGSTRVFDSLATLACDERRADYFSAELVNALHIVERERLEVAGMIGSWAGAMGHTQFMPSAYLRHAVDGDGDGVVDLWNSVPDALASAANFLRSLGWSAGTRWGREVSLPAQFDFYAAGRDRSLDLAQWRRLGVTDVEGRELPALDMRASLLVPAGHEGPAFLVYENFEVIMRWNRSESYALSVGLLADRIAGAGALRKAPPAGLRLTRQQITELQERLSEHGHDSGTPDGIFGPATRGAVRDFQHANGLIADGYAGRPLLEALGIRVD